MDKNKYEKEYWKRIYLLQDYIEGHLSETFTSEQLAKISGLSKYHFHRIFKALTNESIFQYVSRVKMESALGLLTYRLDMSITEIAYELGFSDSAVFSRTFKKYFGISPKKVRNENSNNCKEFPLKFQYNNPRDVRQSNIQGQPRIITVSDMPVIYKRSSGAYSELESYNNALGELYQYGIENDLLEEKRSFPLTIYHTHPDVTTLDNQRTSICVIVKQNVRHVNSDTIGIMEIPLGLYGVIHFEIAQDEYQSAWDYVYGEWLPNSGYLPRNSFPFEVYLNNPLEHPSNISVVDIYIPIEPIN